MIRSARNVNLIFLFLVCLSLFLTIVFFSIWNEQSDKMMNFQGPFFRNFFIEQCVIHDHKIYLKGWAVIPGELDIVARVYAQNQNGTFTQLMTNTRGKVYSHFLDKTNKIKFSSSKIFLKKNNLNRTIYISFQNEKDKSYVSKYYCK